MNADYRYPGSRSFQDTDLDRKLFFGRDTEKDELLHLILAEKLVVLFAKSGMGKTSLLNAGVVQPLRERGFCPINIRLNDPNLTPLQMVYAAIQTPPQPSSESGIPWRSDRQAQSSRTLKRPAENHSGLQPASALRPAIDGWVGDASTQNTAPYQSQPSSDSGEGVREGGSLSQYLSTTEFWSQDDTLLTPVLILDQFEEFFAFYKSEDRQQLIRELAEALKAHTAQPLLKVIIALREDALGQLKELSAELPDIFRNLFRLDYLPRAQARQAIIAPAQLADAEIGIQAFQYAPEAVDAMLDFLCKQQQKQNTVLTDEVEPAQLQLLCQHVEQKVRQRQQHAGAAIVVQKSDLGGENGMQKIVQHFYDRQLKRLRSFWQRRKVRKLCEKGFISKTNRRLSLEEEDIGRRFRVSPKLLARLIDSRLLRAENRGSGRVYYELSHDTLILPIRKSQRKHKIKTWIVGVLFTILMMFASLFLFAYTIRNYTLVRGIATCLTIPEKQVVRGYYRLGSVLSWHGKYDEAGVQYRKAIALNSKFTDAYGGLGWSLNAQGKYDEAIVQYQKIIEIDPKAAWAYVWLGNMFNKQGKSEEAIVQYQKAIKLDHEYAYAYQQLGNISYKQGKVDEARQFYRKAYDLSDKDYHRSFLSSLTKIRFAEDCLMGEQNDQAFTLANEVNRSVNRSLPFKLFPSLFLPHERLAMRFIFVMTLLYQQRRAESLSELQALIAYYYSLKEVNEKWWDYETLHNVISMSAKLTDADKTLLLKLIDVLQSPKAEGDQKLNELEAALPELLEP